jgi:trigger factor
MTDILIQTTAEDVASKSLQVTVPVARVAESEKRAVREYARQVRLPGFRKGHAPEPMVRKRFGNEIKRYVIEDALRESWQHLLETTELKPTSDPQVTNIQFEDGKDLVFDLVVEVRPELTLAATGGFTLTRPAVSVTSEMVQEQLDRLREQRATWSPVEGVRPKDGQLVTLTVVTLEEGKTPAEGQPYSLQLGKGQAIPDLEALVMGMLPGETLEGEVKLPEDHPDEARRGEVRRVRITLHEVKDQVLPVIDDAFAREMGDFADAAALEAAIREDLEADATRTAEAAVRDQLVKALVEANNVPAPATLVRRLLGAYAEAYQIGQEQAEAFVTSFTPVAEAQVKRELALDAVATARNLHCSEADLDAKIAELASARGMEPGALYAQLEQAKRLGELERQVTEEKVFASLLAESTVTEGAA